MLFVARRQFVDGGRQVREKPPGAFEGLFFGIDRFVDRAGAELDLVAAQLVLGELLTGMLDNRRPGDEQGRFVLQHYGIVGGRQVGRTDSRDRTQAESDPRYGCQCFDDQIPADAARQVGAAARFDRLDRAAAARAFDDTEQRKAQ